jgi:hypothetical protein
MQFSFLLQDISYPKPFLQAFQSDRQLLHLIDQRLDLAWVEGSDALMARLMTLLHTPAVSIDPSLRRRKIVNSRTRWLLQKSEERLRAGRRERVGTGSAGYICPGPKQSR